MVLLVMLLPILTECKQEIIPGPGPSNLRESDSSNEVTVALTSEQGVISVPPWSLTPAARTVSFLTDHELELGIRALQVAWLINQEMMFWLIQGSISTDSFGHYRLELAIGQLGYRSWLSSYSGPRSAPSSHRLGVSAWSGDSTWSRPANWWTSQSPSSSDNSTDKDSL